jgi:hypothetical protein
MSNMKAIFPVVLAVSCAIAPASAKEPSFDQQVAAQRAIEQVYWKHRIWPAGNPTPKPALSDVLSETDLRSKVTRALARVAAVESDLGHTITREELQAEVQRMICESRRPDVLDELFVALGRDPVLIEDLLARPLVAEKLSAATSTLASPAGTTCESWSPTATAGAPTAREGHSAIWTGAEMIVWGGNNGVLHLENTGGRYDPATDGWTPTSTGGAPIARYGHAALWTGTTMLVWGGYDASSHVAQTGGRYDVTTDSWTSTSLVDAPSARYQHVAVWTGSEMLVWGGCIDGGTVFDSLVHRYRPDLDAWTTSSSPGPAGQCGVAGVWTGSELLLFGAQSTVTAHRYMLASDTWSEMSSLNRPFARFGPTGIWTGAEMIVWGGDSYTNTGGRYAPSTDTWVPTPTAGAPDGRSSHSAVWSGSEMIVWGGWRGHSVGDGARYDPAANAWSALPATLSPRHRHSAVWTGDEMIVWGGRVGDTYVPIEFFNTGARLRMGPSDETCNGVDDDCDGVVDDGASCDDGNPCNGVEICGGGSCQAGNPVVCTASDQCHDDGTCDPGSGVCSHPEKPDGTACDDGNPTTSPDICQAGVCNRASCPTSPDPKTKGWYKNLCNNSHSGDSLTDADALCVANVTATFAGLQSVADICAVIQPGQSGGDNGDDCGRDEDQLMVLALNLCKQRVCTANAIDSNCGSNSSTVGSSLAEMDTIFLNPERESVTCDHAGCLGKEINNGRALELNSLSVELESGRVRLNWLAPILDDGTQTASSYTVWRRPLGSIDPFQQIAATTGLTFLDSGAGTMAWQYLVKPVVH